MEIVFEINLDRKTLRRRVYSLLDWVGDVGGLFEAMTVITAVLIGIYHYKTFEQYMAEQLFMWKEFKTDEYPRQFVKIVGIRLWCLEVLKKIICTKPPLELRLQ